MRLQGCRLTTSWLGRKLRANLQHCQDDGARAAAQSAASAEQCQMLRREMARNNSVHQSEVESLKMKIGHAEGMLHRESGTLARLRDGVITTRTDLNEVQQECTGAGSECHVLVSELEVMKYI